MGNNNLISIIVPVYNGEKYISRCIDSLVNQDYRKVEIIIIDDGSIDKTKKICERYLKDNRVRYYFQKNQGPSVARNLGIQKAQGQWIMFVDCDDWVSSSFCKDAFNVIKKTRADLGMFLLSSTNHFDGNKLTEDNIPEYKIISKEKAFEYIIDDNIIGHYSWNKIYKKELFDHINFENKKKFEDIGIMYKLVEKAKKIVFINKILYYYFQRSDSIMHTVSDVEINDAFLFRHSEFEFLVKNYPSIVNAAVPAMLSNSLQLLYNCPKKEYRKSREKAVEIIKKYSASKSMPIKYRTLYFITKYMPLLSNLLFFMKKKKNSIKDKNE